MPKVIDSCITWKLSCGHVCKMFGRHWTKELKIASFNYPTLIWRPSPGTPANICINLILPETTFPGLHLCCWQYMGSSANFRTVLSKCRRRQPISCRARNRLLTQNGCSRSFKVVYFGIIEEPLRGYITYIINGALDVKVRKILRAKKKRKSPFSTTPLSFDVPSPANPREYPHRTYLARN